MFWGYVGLIEGIVSRIVQEFGKPMKVVSTGGLAPVFEGSLNVIEHTVPDITVARPDRDLSSAARRT